MCILSRPLRRILTSVPAGRRYNEDLLLFLRNHYLNGRFSNEIYGMLLAQVSTPQRYQNECSACHRRASSLVREAMLHKKGKLMLRKTGQSLQSFLENHRRLNDEDVVFYVDLLSRIAVEVNLKEE